MPDLRPLRMTAGDRRELAAVLYETKREVYVQTLNDLADQYGYTGSAAIVAISRAVDRALRDEAAEHAASIVDTHNAAMADWAKDLPVDISQEATVDAYARWLEDRNEWSARQVAVTEAMTAKSDATLAFFRDAGIPDLEYDFLTPSGGHEAECDLCKALIATNPHSAEQALAIGLPHIQCQHTWIPRAVAAEDMPKRIVVGRTPGGVLGRDTFEQDMGGKRQAAQALYAVAADQG